MSWTAIQLGSREHYAVPVALHQSGCLDCCITDTWLSKAESRFVRLFAPSLASRRNDQLPDQRVISKTAGRLAIDVRLKLAGLGYWQKIMQRNDWFQNWASAVVASAKADTVFSYSYTARRPFLAARKRGVRCILGQIDPGPREEEVVLEATQQYRHLAPPADRAPEKYWDLWREEIAMADKVIVNSPWSAKLLVEAGVPSAKVVEIPLVYAPEARSDEWREPESAEMALRQTSDESGQTDAGVSVFQRFSVSERHDRRLKALFLGSVILRKGVGQLFDAIRMLRNEPVDFTFAGPVGVRIPDEISKLPNVRFLGPVDKATAEALYRESDVFLFPTLSDGFGLTQLEALGHGLPVIASPHCGQVVEDRVSGLVLSEVSPEVIADAIMQLVRDRDLLNQLKANARVPDKCHPKHLAPALLVLE